MSETPRPPHRRNGAMPSPAARIHRMLLAVLAAMAILTGLIPATVLDDHGLPATAMVAHRRPDDDDDQDEDDDTDDDADDSSDDDDTDDSDSDDDDSDDDADADEVDEDELPENVKAILKKERKARRTAERELKRAKRSAKPAAKPKPKAKPKDGDADDEDQPSDREVKATERLRKANLISALTRSKHGLVDPAAAAKLALQDGLADFDDEDEPVDVDDLVKDLTDEYAFLKGSKPRPKAPDIDAGNRRSGKAPKLTADELAAAKAAGMTPEEYANYKSPRPKLPAKKKST